MISKINLTSALVLKVKTGVDGAGNNVYKNITLKKVKPGTLEQDIFDVAQAITTVLAPTFAGLYRQDLDEIVNA